MLIRYAKVNLTFDPLTSNIRRTPGVTWPKSVRNMSVIEQSPAEVLTFSKFQESSNSTQKGVDQTAPNMRKTELLAAHAKTLLPIG